MQFVPFSSSPSSLRLSLLHGVSSALWDSEPPRKQPLDEGAGVPVKLAQAGIATSRQLAPRASAKHGPSPELPSPTPSAAPPPPTNPLPRAARGRSTRLPGLVPRRRGSGMTGRLSTGTRRRGPARAERAGCGRRWRRGRGVGTEREGGLRGPGTGRSHWGSCVPPRPGAGRVAPPPGSWRQAGPAIWDRGVGRPVPGLEVLVINGPQPLAICLPVQSPIDQEILESLARLPKLPAAELTGHRGGDCGPGRRVRRNETESRRRGGKLAALG